MGEGLLEDCTCHSPEMGHVPPGAVLAVLPLLQVHPCASLAVPARGTAAPIAARSSRSLHGPCLQQGTRESETQAREENPAGFLPPCCCSSSGCFPDPSHGSSAEHCKCFLLSMLWSFQTWQCKSIPYTGLLTKPLQPAKVEQRDSGCRFQENLCEPTECPIRSIE